LDYWTVTVKSVVIGFERLTPLLKELKEEGWLRHKEKNPFRNGADVVVRVDECFTNAFLKIPRT